MSEEEMSHQRLRHERAEKQDSTRQGIEQADTSGPRLLPGNPFYMDATVTVASFPESREEVRHKECERARCCALVLNTFIYIT
jgi:hypothetical protein